MWLFSEIDNDFLRKRENIMHEIHLFSPLQVTALVDTDRINPKEGGAS
jgi:hypothetical protein